MAPDRAIVFDLDGTLLTFDREYETLLREAFREANGAAPDEHIQAYLERFGNAFGTLEPEPIRTAFASLDGEIDPDALRESLLAKETEYARTPPGAEDDLARLHESFTLAVLTNGLPEWQREKLEATGLSPYFDAVVSSYVVGAHKPDPAPFREMERRLGADTYAMVGDSESDVEGAESVGWQTHRYEGSGFAELPDVFGWDVE